MLDGDVVKLNTRKKVGYLNNDVIDLRQEEVHDSYKHGQSAQLAYLREKLQDETYYLISIVTLQMLIVLSWTEQCIIGNYSKRISMSSIKSVR